MPDDKDIFAAAMSDAELPPETEATPVVETQPETQPEGERARNPDGTFAPKATVEGVPPPAVEQTAQPVKTEEPPDRRIPLPEYLSEREKRQAAERERDDFRRQVEALNRQQQPKQEPPDVWTDPAAFVRSQLEPVQQGQEAIVERFSRMMAIEKFGSEAVHTAMTELENQMRSNPNARFEHQRIMASDHPYGELVAWHKQQSAMKEIGSDPAAYKTRLREELLKDPEFIKQAMAAARTQAGGAQAQTVPNNVTRLPPSLIRQTAAASNNDGDETDPGDAALFKETVRSK